jgi:hypothetical protein
MSRPSTPVPILTSVQRQNTEIDTSIGLAITSVVVLFSLPFGRANEVGKRLVNREVLKWAAVEARWYIVVRCI